MANMPQTTGAIRKLRADKRRAEVNLMVRTTYKEAIAEFKKKPSVKTLGDVYAKIDRAAKNMVVHKNKAARLKSRLAKLVSSKRS